MTEAGCRGLIDRYVAGGGIAGLSFCANVQRALFQSKVWDRLWDGYDPKGPDDQPALQWLTPENRALGKPNWGRTWVHHLHLLEERGVDHLAVWLDQSRHHGVEAWLSMRMNDVHHVDKPTAFWHNSLWVNQPELRRATYRDEGWFEHALDYQHETVVAHHIALIEELLQRYDCDGLEIDWVRWVRHCAPGQEVAVAKNLTRVMTAARSAANAAANRLGHPVRIAARVPADVSAAMKLGYDIPVWHREGLVDRLILAPFFQQAACHWDIGLWQAVAPNCDILVQPESMMTPWPNAGEAAMVHDYRILAGGAAAALEAGAQGVWLFNECYRFAQHDGFGNGIFGGVKNVAPLLTGTAGDRQALRNGPRRQPLSYHQICGPGEPVGSRLPAPLARPAHNYDFGRFRDPLTLPLDLGPLPDATTPVHIVIGLDEVAPTSDVTMWINGHAINNLRPFTGCGPTQPWGSRRIHNGLPNVCHHGLVTQVPTEYLQAGTNIVELLAPNAKGVVVWIELAVNCQPWESNHA